MIELPINDTLDINGWDVDKTLKLLHKSNPTVFEWFSSPIVYQTTDFAEAFKPLMLRYFSSKSGLWHYLQMAERNNREYLRGDMVKAKKYFYVLRPILACKWIEEKKCPPPVLFSELYEAVLEEEMKPAVEDLVAKKMNMTEAEKAPKIEILNRYIEEKLEYYKVFSEAMEDDRTLEWEPLEDGFRRIVRR